jgi:uncharacterized protein YbcI
MIGQRSRGVVEDEFTKAIIKFEKDYLGRGPLDARTFFVNDMILVRLRGVLTPAETKLAEDLEGQKLVKQARRQLFETARPVLEELVDKIVGCNTISLHSDISTRTGERIIVLTVDKNLDAAFR